MLRSELRRLFGWLKDRGLTTVVTGERGDGQLTRQGIEEYVSDCVVLLGPPGGGPGHHAPPARREVPRLAARAPT